MRFASVLLALLVFCSRVMGQFIPENKIKPDDYTILMTVDAHLAEGLRPFQPGGHGKFFVQDWHASDQYAAWTVIVDQPGEYAANVLIRTKSKHEIRAVVDIDDQKLTANLKGECTVWQRVTLDGTVKLGKGKHKVSLRFSTDNPSDVLNLDVQSIELVQPSVREILHHNAIKARADTRWFQQARYGIMVHWTSESAPLIGSTKPYDQAVADFDTETFAENIKTTGAGFVVFTTSHAYQYFPAPLISLDRILPGRTSKRDLIADLSKSLSTRGIKMMLYFHLGSGQDKDWLRASDFWKSDTNQFFYHWQTLISEVGVRYGDKLAGWWFDDGATTYYYRSAPWEKLNRAAKTGYADRLVTFNAWEMNSPTEFQDFFAGEGFGDPRGFDLLLRQNGDGKYPSGTHAGLQGSAVLVTESKWVYTQARAQIDNPRWTTEQLVNMIEKFAEYKNVPIFNIEITQEGKISPKTLALFERTAIELSKRK